jgi:hypothetical protein
MFFAVKCAFWLSVVALAMPGAEVETAEARNKIGALAALAAPVAAAALSADASAASAAGAKCIAAEHCRAVLTELIRASFAEDAAPSGPPLAKPAARPQKLATTKPAPSQRPARAS